MLYSLLVGDCPEMWDSQRNVTVLSQRPCQELGRADLQPSVLMGPHAFLF